MIATEYTGKLLHGVQVVETFNPDFSPKVIKTIDRLDEVDEGLFIIYFTDGTCERSAGDERWATA